MKTRTAYILLMCAMPLAAQGRSEVSASAGGGLSALNYAYANANASLGLGGEAGLGITFFFDDYWGFGTGAGAALFRSKYAVNELKDNYSAWEGSYENGKKRMFDFAYTLSNYQETQTALVINVPLMLRYQRGRFYAAAGVKAGIPLAIGFSIKETNMSATGKFSDGNLVLPDNDPNLKSFGFGNDFRAASNTGVLSAKIQLFAAIEAGARWQLNKLFALYTGIYADYGINSITKPAETHVIEYNHKINYEKDAYKPNSVLSAKQKTMPITPKLNLVAAGIRITLGFDTKYLMPKRKTPPPIEEEEDEADEPEEEKEETPAPDPEPEPAPEPEPMPVQEAPQPPKPVIKPKPAPAPLPVQETPPPPKPKRKPRRADTVPAALLPKPRVQARPVLPPAPEPHYEQQIRQIIDTMPAPQPAPDQRLEAVSKLADSLVAAPPRPEPQFAQSLATLTDSVLAVPPAVYSIGADELADLETPVGGYAINADVLPRGLLHKLDEKISILNRYPNINIAIEGHTCDLGSHLVNYRIAMKRAAEVKRYFIKKGIDKARIMVVESLAEEQPLVPNTNVTNRRINRRIVVRMLCEDENGMYPCTGQ